MTDPEKSYAGQRILLVGWEETKPLTVEDLQKFWDYLANHDIREYQMEIVDAFKKLPDMPVFDRMDEAEAILYAEKPWMLMNDWRNNRHGKKNR